MKRNSRTWPLLLAVAMGGAAAPPVNGQGDPSEVVTNALSLERAILIALEHNPGLRASGARVDAAAGRADQARRWSNPELELNAEDWPVSGGRGFSDAKRTIGVAQTLPFPGKKTLDKQAAGAGVRVSESELVLRRTELVRDVKAAFFRVLASEQLVDVSAQLVTVAASSAATARKRVDAGATAYQEQLRAEVQLEQARAELTGYQRGLAAARQSFGTLLGRAELGPATLVGALTELPVASLADPVDPERLAAHPSLAAAQASLDRAQLANRRARLEAYPDVTVGLAGGRIGATDQSILQLGFSVPLPLLDRGKGRQQESLATVREAEAELHSVRQQLHREWADARDRYRAAADHVAAYRERLLPRAAEALKLVQTGFEQGKFSFIDLVDTQRTTAEARLAYHGKLLELNIAQAELEALLQPHASQLPPTR